jgi:hypothetical protein
MVINLVVISFKVYGEEDAMFEVFGEMEVTLI